MCSNSQVPKLSQLYRQIHGILNIPNKKSRVGRNFLCLLHKYQFTLQPQNEFQLTPCFPIPKKYSNYVSKRCCRITYFSYCWKRFKHGYINFYEIPVEEYKKIEMKGTQISSVFLSITNQYLKSQNDFLETNSKKRFQIYASGICCNFLLTQLLNL